MGEENKGELMDKIKVREIGSSVDAERPVDFGFENISTPEQVPAEKSPEQVPKENFGSEGEGEIGGIVSASRATQIQTRRIKEIENVLQDENVVEAYLAMTPERRREFKMVGEETARKINELMSDTKIKIKKIVDLIKKWLFLIPGVNIFFLEQEAKIKTDELIRLKNESDDFKQN